MKALTGILAVAVLSGGCVPTANCRDPETGQAVGSVRVRLPGADVRRVSFPADGVVCYVVDDVAGVAISCLKNEGGP